jgi:iron only hydrogenase large subunit-like protein
MNSLKPVYTEKNSCQDCYKCVRQCPVKAIHVVDGSAAISPERCIYCGTCVTVCPVGAKKVRDDLGRAKLLVRRKEKVVASLAPSFVSEFPGVPPGNLIHALKTLGFSMVSETALGAQEISAACAAELAAGGPGVYLSTACPTAVELIRKYQSAWVPSLTRLVSPLLAHCKLLRKEYGEDLGIVFIGPCVSKKLEADANPALLDLTLSFADLHRWFEEKGIDPRLEEARPNDTFRPHRAGAGALYPVDGGMVTGVQGRPGAAGVQYLSFSGMHNLQTAMDGLEAAPVQDKLFLELLACEGGCINGPQTTRTCGIALKRLQVLAYAAGSPPGATPVHDLDVAAAYVAEPVEAVAHAPAEILRALRQLGKTSHADELNCGGCGYDQCSLMAAAMLEGRAEPDMCVSHMRKLAQNKANALIRSMPSGVVIVDGNLTIVECNRKFAEYLGEETLTVFEARPGMAGASLVKVAPFHGLFTEALHTEEEVLKRDLRLGDRVIRLSVFPIESGHMVGGILQDITEPAVEREHIIRQAQDIIHRNVTTVQQIAFLLGENAADTEMILGSIITSFQLPAAKGAAPDER